MSHEKTLVTGGMEWEANVFAMALLMPAEQFVPASRGLDFTDDDAVKKLAARFKVPLGACLIWVGILASTGAYSE